MEEKYLPIGTVCRLKGATKALMIEGFCVRKQEDDKVYDYLGCIYPHGRVDSNANFLFDHSQIEEILHKGLVNEQELDFKKALVQLMNNRESTEQTTAELSQAPAVPSAPETPVAPQPQVAASQFFTVETPSVVSQPAVEMPQQQQTEPVTTTVPNMFWSTVDTTNSTTN